MTADQLQKIMGCPPARAATYCVPLALAAAEFDIATPKRLAAFLAQVGHESGRLAYVEEIDSGAIYNGRADLGNTKPEALRWSDGHPGPYFKGHGLIQITGFDNHAAAGAALHPDDAEIYLRNPRALCAPVDAARSAAWFWKTHGCNELADAGEFERITRAINGGLNGLADRLLLWASAQKVLA